MTGEGDILTLPQWGRVEILRLRQHNVMLRAALEHYQKHFQDAPFQRTVADTVLDKTQPKRVNGGHS